MSNRILLRGAALLSLVAAAACSDDNAKVLGPIPSQGNGIFQSYVSLGNSITAGYQSGGINDSTQQRSYAVLLGRQIMGTRFAYPSLANPGCPPPIANFQTQARVGNGTSTTCALRNGTTAVINNVAVPGAASIDPDLASSTLSPPGNSNILTQLFLGGLNQAQRAAFADPTFATIWIGNNDVLPAALSGVLVAAPNISPGVTAQQTFQTNYDAMVAALQNGSPHLKSGVLIGVVNVTNAAALIPVSVLLGNAAFRGGFDLAAGYNPASSDPFKNTPLNIESNCNANPTTLVSLLIAGQIAAFRNDSTKPPQSRTGHPPDISCGTSSIYPAPVGQIFILEPAEITALTNAVNGYNTYISTKAGSLGFAYFNPNQVLDSLKALGQITPPNFASATAPFGKWISLDGIHPTSAAHVLLANYLADAINKKYSTTLSMLPVP